MIKIFPLLAAVALAGCATTSDPAVEVRYVEVVVEVQKPCPGPVPVRPKPLARPLPSELDKLVITLAQKLAEYSDPGNYADQADAWIKRCSTPTEENNLQ